MRIKLSSLLAAAALVVVGCGSGSDVTYPATGVEIDGYPSVQVVDSAEASELRDSAQESWPEEWNASPTVTLDILDTEEDMICVRP